MRNTKFMPTAYNLEPIEESDLNLEQKFGLKSAEKHSTEDVPQPGASEDHEMVLEAVQEKEVVPAREKALEQIRQTVSAIQAEDTKTVTTVQQDTDELSNMEEEARISRLVNIALEKGPKHAFRVAIKLDDLYALDKLHDTLVEKLYDELVKKGFIRTE